MSFIGCKEDLDMTTEEYALYLKSVTEDTILDSLLEADIRDALKSSEDDSIEDELVNALALSLAIKEEGDVEIIDDVMTVSGVTRVSDFAQCSRTELNDGVWSFGSGGVDYIEQCHGSVSAQGDTGMCFYLSVKDGNMEEADQLKASLRRADPVKHDKRYNSGVWATDDVVETYVRMTHNTVTIFQEMEDKSYQVVMFSPVGCRHPHGHIFLRKDWTHYTRLYPS